MESEGVLIPFIHKHPMMPCNDLRKGNCCEGYEVISDGYYCKICDFFFHKICTEFPEYIKHPSHPDHTLQLQCGSFRWCSLCGRTMLLSYYCEICGFVLDLYCARYPPPEVIDIPDTHHHKLIHLKEEVNFDCAANCDDESCNEYGFPYKCQECDLAFHIECVWHPSEEKHMLEVNHPYHFLHPLKLLKGKLPDYFDGKCRLCGRTINDRLFYHCSSCKFSLDMRCVLNPPPEYVLDLKTHPHQLTLLPRLDSFTCNVCGLKGDRSPYICVPCDFVIHQDCVGRPRLININRHDHRISRTYVLGVVNSVCGVCRKKVDWNFGGYSCQRCPGYVVHSKCATRKYVWNGKELEGVPEETEDIEPYEVIDDNTIQHFSHKEHHLRFNFNDVLCDDKKRCSACTHPICLQSFYGCMDCDFILHQNCAELPTRKWHVLHNERLTLVTNVNDYFDCAACGGMSNGFMYQDEDKKLDVRCGSVCEPFFHPSHPQHPLYSIPGEKYVTCNGCNEKEYYVLRCIEDGCGYVLGFKCATLPQVVKHRVDNHPLSLCYGKKASGIYWCDICEKKTNPTEWFYTCKDRQSSLHTECVLGDFLGLMPKRLISCKDKSYEVVLNDSISRPFCFSCKSHCIRPIILKMFGTSDVYFCSIICFRVHLHC